MKRLKIALAAVTLISAISILSTVAWAFDGSSSSTKETLVQDPASLDRRISMVEQRFYIVENGMRRLEQQITQRASLPEPQRVEDSVLRAEIEQLKAQVQVLNCAVAKLDERTLPANLRQSSRDDRYKDPCRVNPETPLRPPARQ